MDFKGVDVFMYSIGLPRLPEEISGLKLKSISNRGVLVWPGNLPPVDMTDLFQARFVAPTGTASPDQITSLLEDLDRLKVEWVHVEKLLLLNGKEAFSGTHGAS
jgi:isocitrate dehydrogenase